MATKQDLYSTLGSYERACNDQLLEFACTRADEWNVNIRDYVSDVCRQHNYTHAAIARYRTLEVPTEPYQDGMTPTVWGTILLDLKQGDFTRSELNAAAQQVWAFQGTPSYREVAYSIKRKRGFHDQYGWVVESVKLEFDLNLVTRCFACMAANKDQPGFFWSTPNLFWCWDLAAYPNLGKIKSMLTASAPVAAEAE